MTIGFNIRQTLVIARRDLTARVWTPLFLIVLFAPLMMILLGALAMVASGSMTEDTHKRTIVAVVDADVGSRMTLADRHLRNIVPQEQDIPALRIVRPDPRRVDQAKAIVAGSDGMVSAAISDTASGKHPLVVQRHVVKDALWLNRVRAEADRPPLDGSVLVTDRVSSEGLGNIGRDAIGRTAVMVMFLLVYLLGSQVGSSLIEERSNKIIDVLSAATPLECILFGKLIAEYAIALIFMTFYGGMILAVPAVLPAGAKPFIDAIGTDAGWSFVPLFAMYFTTAYLIYSATIIALGSMAATPQGARLLLLPVGLLQFGALSVATTVNTDGGTGFLLAAAFPYTSPLVMTAAHFASIPPWQHAAAVLWQFTYITLMLWLAARAFRRTALQSGPAPSRSRIRRMKAEARSDGASRPI